MVCKHHSNKPICTFDAISLYNCNRCGLIFSAKYWEDFDTKQRYEQYYKNEISGRFNFGIEYLIRSFRFFRALKIFTIYPRAKSILDIGSGRGFMLYYLKKYFRYQRTVGTQIAQKAFEFSRHKLGLEIYGQDLLELPVNLGSFDIITIWHVLEHVPEPEKYIEKIFNLLSPGGKLVIEVPNFNSWTRKLTDKYWLGLDLEHHLIFFTPQTLSLLLQKHNFNTKLIHTFSLEYSAFISTQSIISLLTRSHHLFFQYLQTSIFTKRIIGHIFLFALLSPFCFLINILLYFSQKGEVLLMIAEKSKSRIS